jgi:hypothetical protein
MRDIGEWKDITEETFKGLAKYCIEDLLEGWQCSLCEKYRYAHEGREIPQYEHRKEKEAYEKIRQDSPVDHNDENATALSGVEAVIGRKRERIRQVDRISAFERMHCEILDVLFSQMDRESLPNCIYLSSRIYDIAIKKLYYRVQLMSDFSTRNFAETLINRPILKDYVRQLLTVINPHWESVAVLHGILKRLPFLTLLEIGPSWITYGDLPYREYPFKLEGLKWGLIKDRAAKRFIESQSTHISDVVYWGLPSW